MKQMQTIEYFADNPGPLRVVKMPRVVNAMVWNGTISEAHRVMRWVNDLGGSARLFDEMSNPYLVIQTLEGPMRADAGWFIIQGIEGEFYPCKTSVFSSSYRIATEEDEPIIDITPDEGSEFDPDEEFPVDPEVDPEVGEDFLDDQTEEPIDEEFDPIEDEGEVSDETEVEEDTIYEEEPEYDNPDPESEEGETEGYEDSHEPETSPEEGDGFVPDEEE